MALDNAINNILGDRKLNIAILLEMVFPSETIRAWSGRGDINYGGKTWTGDSSITGFDKVGSDIDFNENKVNISMAFDKTRPMMQDIIDGQGNEGNASLTLLFLADDLTPISDEPIFVGFIDGAMLAAGEKSLEARVTLSSETSKLRRVTNHNLTDSAQQAIFPGDRGLEYATNPVDTQFGSSSTGSRGSSSGYGQVANGRVFGDFI